ncbi:MAG: ABC transporter permease subunit, partial [Actinomycetota bacterium]|nr:ABC transporter permease subunit [Actinomycetota bacterium]
MPPPRGHGQRLLVLVVAGACVLLLVVPLAGLVATAAADGAAVYRVLTSPGLGEAVLNTVVLAVVVTLLAVPAGVAVALALRRPDLPARRVLQVAVLLPVLVPQFVLGYSWRQAYGPGGFTDAALGVQVPGLLGAPGVVLVLAVNAVPVTYLVTAVGLAARAEPNLERAARASGAGPLTALRTVTLPLLRPSVVAASVLVFVLTLESFAVPQVLGTPGGFTTVTTRIYANLSLGSDPFAFVEAVVLALLLVVFAGLVIAPADALLAPRLRSPRVADSGGAAAVTVRRSTSRWAAATLGGFVLAAVGLPLLALVAASVTRAVGLPPTPRNWTLDHFSVVLDERTVDAVGLSLTLAVAAATLL